MMQSATLTPPAPRNGGFYLLQFIRILVGLVFIFSGLIKANDPSGLAYKMQEFFELWRMPQFSKFAFELSIAVITFEIVSGVALLMGYAFRTVSILLVLLMLFFGFLTGYAIWYEQVNNRELKCGCFGDCIPLTAMQSFLKDVVLLVLVLILLYFRKYIRPLFAAKTGHILMAVALVLSLLIQYRALQHLPFIDCLPYKVGNNIWKEMQVPEGAKPDVYKTVMTFEKDGKQIKVSQDEFMADSTLWNLTPLDTKTELVEKGNALPVITDFALMGYDGQEYTEAVLTEPGYNFLLFIRDTDRAALKNIERIQKLLTQVNQGTDVGLFILSSNDSAKTAAFCRKYKLDTQVFLIDNTVSKTAMRSSPGLMLIKGGTVIGKWSYNDYPEGYKMNSGKLEIIK